MRNLAIIGASYLQVPLILKAKEMGFSTHVFAWKANDVGENIADYFYPISIIEKDAILEKCREIGICGICSIASDLAVITVNYIANALGLIGNDMETTKRSTNKYYMRMAFEKNSDPSPKSIQVDENTNLSTLSLSYPVIVKPTDTSGSRGIYKLDSKKELRKAVHLALLEGFEKKALIEEYIEGQEYSVEYISYNGEHYFLAMTMKFTTGAPHFIEVGHLEPAPVKEEILKKVQRVVVHALNTLGIYNSASHSEVKIDKEGNVKIIEIGGRMGGDCIGSDMVQYSTGIDFVRAVIQLACGEKPDLTPIGKPQSVKSVFIFTQEDFDELKRIELEEPERLLKKVYIREDLIGKTTNSSNRAGCYLIKA